MSDNPQPSGYIDWSDDDLDELATITPADIGDAEADAREFPELDALLNAKKTKEGEE